MANFYIDHWQSSSSIVLWLSLHAGGSNIVKAIKLISANICATLVHFGISLSRADYSRTDSL